MQPILPHPLIVGIPWCMCTHPIDYMGVHLLRCTHDNEHTWTHDAICNTFVTIAWDDDFHVGHKQLHVIPSTTFNSFCQWINVVFTKYGIRTLTNIIIANPIWANLFLQSCATWKFVVFETTQAKEKSYYDQHPTYQFLPLTIEVFRCLNKHVDIYLRNCANAMWNFKRPEGFPHYVLVTFSSQKNSITLQRMQASSILSWTVGLVSLIISQLPPFKTTPITTIDIL
jgi:hypothetical protein